MQKRKLPLGEISIDERKWNGMKGLVPCRKPWVLPFIGHGDDILRVEMYPFMIAPLHSLRRWKRLRQIAVEPGSYVVVVELL